MAKGLNKVFLMGNLGKDPEIRATPSGMTIASVSLATADRKKDASGAWQDTTEWHNLVAFDRLAEVMRDYTRKGSKVLVEGKIVTRSWDDKDSGQKKHRTEIIVNELTMLDGKPKEDTASGHQASASGGDYVDQGITDDDIPF